MKHLNLLKTGAGALALLALDAGCVSATKYSYQDAPKNNVQLASVTAASTFYDAMLAKRFPAQGPPHGMVTVYVPMPYHHVTRSSSNVLLNAATAQADANHDGVISEEEAQAFATRK